MFASAAALYVFPWLVLVGTSARLAEEPSTVDPPPEVPGQLKEFAAWEIAGSPIKSELPATKQKRMVFNSATPTSVYVQFGSLTSLQGYWASSELQATTKDADLQITMRSRPKPDWGSKLIQLGKVSSEKVYLDAFVVLSSPPLPIGVPAEMRVHLKVTYPTRLGDTSSFFDATSEFDQSFTVVGLQAEDYSAVRAVAQSRWNTFLAKQRPANRWMAFGALVFILGLGGVMVTSRSA